MENYENQGKIKINTLVILLPQIIIILFFIVALFETDWRYITGKELVILLYLLIIFGNLLSISGKAINILTTQLSFNNKIISGKSGLFKRTYLDAPLNKINNINLKQSFAGIIFHYYTIEICTSSNKYRFYYIKNGLEFKNILMGKISEIEK